MTLDKFGRHILKHARITDETTTSLDKSSIMYYTFILNFHFTTLRDTYYVFQSDETTYTFPLPFATIQNIRSNVEDVSICINEKETPLKNVNNYSIEMGNTISFRNHNFSKDKNNNLYIELILKCPVQFEHYSVVSERAYYKE